MSKVNRRTFIAVSGLLPIIGSLHERVGSALLFHSNEKESESETKETPGETNRSDGFSVSLDDIETVTEGAVETITVTVTNPTDEYRSEKITVDRDGRDTLAKEFVQLDAGNSTSVPVTWHVRNDAAGHTMEITASGVSDSDSTRISGIAPIHPSIDDLSYDNTAETVTATYRIENTGSAPTSTSVEVRVDGEILTEEQHHLRIGGNRELEEVFTAVSDKHVLTIQTVNGATSETVVPGNHE